VTDDSRAFVTRIASPVGLLTLASDGEALIGLWMEGQRYFGKSLPTAYSERKLPIMELAQRWLELYFRGREPDYFPPVQLGGTPFQHAVWEALRTIPYGETMTYGELARQLSAQVEYSRVSARAVGGAVARNPISILIPCHRVVGANGTLTGYAGGLDRKQKLLALERNGLSQQRNVYFVQISETALFHT